MLYSAFSSSRRRKLLQATQLATEIDPLAPRVLLSASDPTRDDSAASALSGAESLLDTGRATSLLAVIYSRPEFTDETRTTLTGWWKDLQNQASADRPITMIVNAFNGNAAPGSFDFLLYRDALRVLRQNPHVRTLGYVGTTWGARDPAVVSERLDWYENDYVASNGASLIDGIFLDEFEARTPTQLTYYQNLAAEIRGRSDLAGNTIVGNPGSAFMSDLLDETLGDAFTTFEGGPQAFSNAAPPQDASSNLEFGAVVYDVPAAEYVEVVRSAKLKGYDFVFVTDDLDNDGNPYNDRPSYWNELATELDRPVAPDLSVTLLAESPAGSPVAVVTGFDPNPGQSVTYEIVAGNTDEAFEIEPSTGQLKVKNATALDFAAHPAFQLTIELTDDGADQLRGTTTVSVQLLARPKLESVASPLVSTENAVAKPLAPTASVADADSANFDGGSLNVQIAVGGQNADRLTIRNQGTGANQVGVSGSNVTFGGTVVGSFSGGTGTTPLVIFWNAEARPLRVQAVLRNILYQNLSDNPTNFGANPSRTINYVLDDGDGATSVAVNQTLNITAVNDKPVLAGIPSPQAYKENAAAKLLAPQATVADPDSANFASGKLTVKSTAGGLGSDRLTIRHQGSGPGQVGVSGDTLGVGGVVVGTFTGGTGLQPLVITFNADAKLLRVQAVLRNISYQNISDNPTNFGANQSRTVNYVLTDGDGGTSVAVNQTLNITAVNDAVVVGNFTDASTYTAGAGATILDANATVTDADSANFAGGNLVLMFSAGGVATNRLAIRNQGTGANQIGVSGSNVTFGGTVIGTLNANAGIGLNALIVTFTDAATPGRVQALLRNLTYQSTTANPTGPKTLTLKVRDGDGGLTTVNKPLNIAPALAGPARSSAAFASYADWEGAL